MVVTITVFQLAAPRRGAGDSTKSFYYISGRSVNFLLPSVFGGYEFPLKIEIINGKVFSLFSEHRKSSILLYSFRKKKKMNKLND